MFNYINEIRGPLSPEPEATTPVTVNSVTFDANPTAISPEAAERRALLEATARGVMALCNAVFSSVTDDGEKDSLARAYVKLDELLSIRNEKVQLEIKETK